MVTILLEIRDLPNQMTLKSLIEAAGHRVETILPEWDVAIVDTRLRAETLAREGPVLLVTSMADRSDTAKSLRAGVFGTLLTPFEPTEVAVTLQRAIRSHAGTARPNSPYDFSGQLVSLERMESQYILEVLRRCKNNQAEAARVLDIGRNTLWRKLKKINAQLHRES